MANEIKLTFRLDVAKDNFRFQTGIINTTADLVGSAKCSSTQIIGTAVAEALEISVDLGDPRWAIFTNLDAENFVEVGVMGISSSHFQPSFHLEPGALCVVPLATTDLFALADTAPVMLDYTIISE